MGIRSVVFSQFSGSYLRTDIVYRVPLPSYNRRLGWMTHSQNRPSGTFSRATTEGLIIDLAK
jgi:hypothetical protein